VLAGAARAVAALIEAASSVLLVGFVPNAGVALLRGGGRSGLGCWWRRGRCRPRASRPARPSSRRQVVFAAIPALRTALKRAFAAEQAAVARPGGISG
jgi:hypothetical protein